jgi:hypothetical protein
MEIPSLFDHLSNLTIKKAPWEETNGFKKNYTQFIINRFVGMNDTFLPLIEELIKMDIPDEVHYNFLLEYLPKKKVFFKYISKTKAEMTPEQLKIMMEVFDASPNEAVEYFQILPQDKIKDLFKRFSNGGVISKRKAK